MATLEAYISAGLPVPKSDGQSPTSQVLTAYVAAGLPPEVEEAAAAGGVNAIIGGGIIV